MSGERVIKFTTSPWPLTQEQFNFYTPANSGIVNGYRFEVNNDCRECDFWIVRGNLQKRTETVKCPPGNVIFLQDEVYDERQFNKDFLGQFGAVIGPRKDVVHDHFLYNHEMVPWFFKERGYDELLQKQVDPAEKTKMLCLMTSDATWIKGHRTRFAFSNKLIGHFKNRMDVYGRGFRPFECKFEVLQQYKYCIALENTVYPGYFTEKINECFLSETFPVYYGCPDLESYYDAGAFARIDADRFEESIAVIEGILQSDMYLEKLPAIRGMKRRYLERYHLPIQLVNILEKHNNSASKKRKVRVYSEAFYYDAGKGLYHLKMGTQILAARAISKISSMF